MNIFQNLTLNKMHHATKLCKVYFKFEQNGEKQKTFGKLVKLWCLENVGAYRSSDSST